jgi:pimeloyl-ACP methyl ester carboxylesterase
LLWGALVAVVAVIVALVAWPVVSFLARSDRVAPEEHDGFRWPYFLYVSPSAAAAGDDARVPVLVVPNNTGRVDDDPGVHEREARVTAYHGRLIANELGAVLLVPAFPRPDANWQVYTHALDRDCLLVSDPRLRRLDRQLVAMLDDASVRLGQKGVAAERSVFMLGYSAAGMFVNRFALLHPNRVAAAAVGSPGGWPIVPVSEAEGRSLRYPIGIADVAELIGEEPDLDAYLAIPHLFMLGSEDENDSVPYDDGYEDVDEELIMGLFGGTPVERWSVAREIYAEAGANATFVLYPGVGHDFTAEMERDVVRFFEQVREGAR